SSVLVIASDVRSVGALRLGRNIENVSITTRSKDHRVGEVAFDFSRNQISSDDAAGLAFDDNEIEHFRPRKHRYFPVSDLTEKRLIGAKQKLLAGLAARVKRARDLSAPERTIGKHSSVFTSKGHTLGDALVD